MGWHELVRARSGKGGVDAKLKRLLQDAEAGQLQVVLTESIFSMDGDAADLPALADWQKQLAPYRGAKIVTYHRDFIYFAQRFGLSIVDELEPKPGIAPSPAHLAQVIGEMKRNNVKLILVQPFQNRKTAETVARQTGAAVVDAPQQPGAANNTSSYFDNMDNLVRAIAAALGGRK